MAEDDLKDLTAAPVMRPSDDTQTPQKPLVRYGKAARSIPGDPFGRKKARSGNISHVEDPQRAREFPKFSKADLSFVDAEQADRLLEVLSSLRDDFISENLDRYEEAMVIRDDKLEKVVEFRCDTMTARVAQFKDVCVTDRNSYHQTQRAFSIEARSEAKIKAIEPPMGRLEEDYLMARAVKERRGPKVPMHRRSERRPEGGPNMKVWYKQLRTESHREFWMQHNRKERDKIREAADNPENRLRMVMDTIAREDRSQSQDPFYQYFKDTEAASDNFYEHIKKDIILVLDKDGDTILCSVSRLFQRLYGEARTAKVTDAVKKWSAIPPLPQPETSRHMVDDLIRRKHPGLDMEKAKTPKELEERAMCVVHYGTWAMQGHLNPLDVYLTADTKLSKGAGLGDKPNYAAKSMRHLKRGVFGLSSEVVRFLLRAVAPKEHHDCVQAFRGLPKTKRMAVSQPNWATLFVLGINSFTQRHRDRNDIKHGFAGLVPLGEYEGGDLCFPQLGFKIDYKPGNCVIFRGAELEHFVSDWTGYRIFVIATNHQPVLNWVDRRRGRAPALPTDPWFRKGEDSDESSAHPTDDEDDEDIHSMCPESDLDQDEPPESD